MPKTSFCYRTLIYIFNLFSKTIGRRIDWCNPVGFKAAPGPVVALASFPGSGNTWVRYLLQQATGILTGSVYKDYALLKNGFPAESIVNGWEIVPGYDVVFYFIADNNNFFRWQINYIFTIFSILRNKLQKWINGSFNRFFSFNYFRITILGKCQIALFIHLKMLIIYFGIR